MTDTIPELAKYMVDSVRRKLDHMISAVHNVDTLFNSSLTSMPHAMTHASRPEAHIPQIDDAIISLKKAKAITQYIDIDGAIADLECAKQELLTAAQKK